MGFEHIMALNKNGVSLLDQITHETLIHYPFTEVLINYFQLPFYMAFIVDKHLLIIFDNFVLIIGDFNKEGSNGRWNLVFGHEMWKPNAAKNHPYSNRSGLLHFNFPKELVIFLYGIKKNASNINKTSCFRQMRLLV